MEYGRLLHRVKVGGDAFCLIKISEIGRKCIDGKNLRSLEGQVSGRFPLCLLGGGLFSFKFQTLHCGSLKNHQRGHGLRFKTQRMAPTGKFSVPGDEEMSAFKTVDLLGFHDQKAAKVKQPSAGGKRKKGPE